MTMQGPTMQDVEIVHRSAAATLDWHTIATQSFSTERAKEIVFHALTFRNRLSK